VVLEHEDEPQQIIIQDEFMEAAGDLRAHFTSRYLLQSLSFISHAVALQGRTFWQQPANPC